MIFLIKKKNHCLGKAHYRRRIKIKILKNYIMKKIYLNDIVRIAYLSAKNPQKSSEPCNFPSFGWGFK